MKAGVVRGTIGGVTRSPRLALLALATLATASACAPRGDGPLTSELGSVGPLADRAPGSVAAPPFTLDVARDEATLVVRVVPGQPLRGIVDLEVRAADGRVLAGGPIAPGLARRVAVDPHGARWTVVARWRDPLGTAGATAIRELPEPAVTAPRFGPTPPVVLGGVRVEAAVRIP